MLQKIYNLIFGDYNEKYIKSLLPLVEQINKKEEEYQTFSEEEFLKNTEKFKIRLRDGETVHDLLIEAFATVKNACRRLTEKKHSFTLGGTEMVWNMVPYDVQLLGGIVLHEGKISEMKTGEGKTLVSVAPLYLNALEGKGVHLVTANDYLAERDAFWNGQVFNYLGLTVGVIKHGQNNTSKKIAYSSDITYGTNNEYGFDYLRDNMAIRPEQLAMRGLHYAIVDEVDSILIDESRTPLIISAPQDDSTDKYYEYAKLTKQLQKDTDYLLDEKEKTAILTEEGIRKVERFLGVENIYTDRGYEELHYIESTLKAYALFKKDIDYVVSEEGEILIVDEFTGRIMQGRRYSGGLHQAIEAKENVRVKEESITLASITFQNYFRLYKKLAGMTGTALTEAKEFAEIYKLDTIVIPTNKPVVRIDKPDAILKNAHGKYQSIIKRVRTAYDKGQPVLIGTISIEKSELISTLLQKEGIPHTVLNAKHHAKEAEIIANAGAKGAVTIATNMAGRGTDIKPSPEAYEAGGLLVIGTERHESRRIDNQLRGRSGRQGDPGETQFFVSMDDDLMRLFGADRMKNMMETMGIPDDMPIENSIITNGIESAQKKVEHRNFEIRKHLLQYDDVMNVHRERIYAQRNAILREASAQNLIVDLIKKYVGQLVESHVSAIKPELWNYEELLIALQQFGSIPFPSAEELDKAGSENVALLKEFCIQLFLNFYKKKEESIGQPEALRHAEKVIYLRNIDRFWMDHLNDMTRLRETVSLRAYSNKNPLYEYKQEAFELFRKLMLDISVNTIRELVMVEIQSVPQQFVQVMPEIANLQTNEDQIESNITNSQILPLAEAPKSVDGVTVYRADEIPEKSEKIGRNDLCPCGSGKKYKKCHGA